jgi:hypothetical protein
MKAEKVCYTLYRSEVCPDCTSRESRDAELIKWADQNPVVWKLITGSRSKLFGRKGSHYLGCEQGVSNPMGRLWSFHRALAEDPNTIFGYRARYTLEHIEDKGLKTGFFQQFDGSYDRHCILLDYVPKDLDIFVRRFVQWAESGVCSYDTDSVKLDAKTIRTREQIDALLERTAP